MLGNWVTNLTGNEHRFDIESPDKVYICLDCDCDATHFVGQYYFCEFHGRQESEKTGIGIGELKPRKELTH